jgi:hypothetical protein
MRITLRERVASGPAKGIKRVASGISRDVVDQLTRRSIYFGVAIDFMNNIMSCVPLRVIVALVLGLPAIADAQCVIFDKPEDLFGRADVVFVGTIVSTEHTHDQGSHVIVDIGTFRVEQAWKGRVEREMRVGADRLFELNTKYVVFAAGKPLSTSIPCKWTEPVDRAKAKLDWLGKRPALRRGRSGNSNTEILRVFLRREAP